MIPADDRRRDVRCLLALGLSAALALVACGSSSGGGGPTDLGPELDGGTCTASIAAVPFSGATHVGQGTQLTFSSNPPAGGDHYPEWLRWAERYDVVERGNYVHNEEHGGVVLINPCATGCDELSAALERIGRALPQDPLCAPPINARWVVVRDPLLPPGTGVAAAAWGATFVAPCFDRDQLITFIEAHYGRATEATCAQGTRP